MSDRDSLVTWKQLDCEDGDTWQCSGCGFMSVWEDNPEDNDVKYCTFCGHPVKFETYEDPSEEITQHDIDGPGGYNDRGAK